MTRELFPSGQRLDHGIVKVLPASNALCGCGFGEDAHLCALARQLAKGSFVTAVIFGAADDDEIWRGEVI
jgi:hypothetical protein